MDKNSSNDFLVPVGGSRFHEFESEDDWFDYRLEHDPRFLVRVERARKGFQAGQGIRLEDIHWDEKNKK